MSVTTPFIRLRSALNRFFRYVVLTVVGLSPLLHASILPAQSTVTPPVLSDSALQVLYLYNFTKFIEWPERVFSGKQAPIRLCIYGEKPSEIRQSAGSIEGKIVQGRSIAIRRTATLAELNDCQIVFISGVEERWLSEVLRIAHAASALTVSDMDEFVELGGGVGLLMVDHQIRFEFNLDATGAAQLKISSQLLKLAKAVKGQGARN